MSIYIDAEQMAKRIHDGLLNGAKPMPDGWEAAIFLPISEFAALGGEISHIAQHTAPSGFVALKIYGVSFLAKSNKV